MRAVVKDFEGNQRMVAIGIYEEQVRKSTAHKSKKETINGVCSIRNNNLFRGCSAIN